MLRPLFLQLLLQHLDMFHQLLVDALRLSGLAFLLRDLRLHFCALNIPSVSCSFVGVPFKLEEAHYTCNLMSAFSRSYNLHRAVVPSLSLSQRKLRDS
jgi:hypothetical protein